MSENETLFPAQIDDGVKLKLAVGADPEILHLLEVVKLALTPVKAILILSFCPGVKRSWQF